MGFTRAILALCATVMLSACLVTPGKFTSTLDIRKDRGFAFTYKGEVIALNVDKPFGDGAFPDGGGDTTEGEDSVYQAIAQRSARPKSSPPAPKPVPEDSFAAQDRSDRTKMEAIAAALRKEKGFRSVRYTDNGRFEIDYAIDGRLDHAFVFPFNIDAQMVVPFVAIELRGGDTVRVKAPGYANSTNRPGNPLGSEGEEAAEALDGTFTLTTDATIVSQNQEDGPSSVAGGQAIVWKVNALTNEAPMAVLKLTAP